MRALSSEEQALLHTLLLHPGVRAKAIKQLDPQVGSANCVHLLARLHRKGLVYTRDGAWYPTDAGQSAVQGAP